MIAADSLRAVGCTAEAAGLYAGPLTEACIQYGINTPERLAAFLAQIGHESGGMRYVREIWGPTPAQLTYEGRVGLGNVRPGDGRLFLGRGLIQLTGRDNYRAMRDSLRADGIDAPDFESAPDLLEQPRWACLTAAKFWTAHGCNALADAGDFDGITRRINGGTNGTADRRSRWAKAKAALAAVSGPEKRQERPLNAAPDGDAPQPEKPMAPFIIPAVIELAKLIPKLGVMFGGSEVAQRNVGAASVVVDAVVGAVGAANAQQAVEKIAADPAALAAATKAVESVWYQITEAGGGGIDGAGKRDALMQAEGDIRKSASFWIALLLLPLVYLLVLSLIGLVGTANWGDDVRAGLAGSLISAIIGGLVGYYYGQTTSRNRAAAP